MRLTLTRLASRNLLTLFVTLILLAIFAHISLPYDHTIRSLVRFHWGRVSSLVSTPISQQTWFLQPPKHPVRFEEDVGLIVKTGYGTQDRIVAQMEAMGLNGTSESMIVVGDFEARLEQRGILLDVVNVVEAVVEAASVNNTDPTSRVLKYQELRAAIDSADEETAQTLGKQYGRHLDAIKFIPGLELAYKQAPYKRWWVIMDDDTFLLKSSLERLLARLDPLQDHYVGNAVGDYKARFAHGGSAIAISQRTLAHLFEKPGIIAEAKINSLTETWGDKLVATTLMKLGVYLNEDFNAFFNGFQPIYTRVNAENFCLPIASFHDLSDATNMNNVGNIFNAHRDTMVFWGAIWNIYAEPDMTEFNEDPIRPGRDHVGRLDETTTTFENVDSALECVTKCDTASSTCLAWTWEERTWKCHLAPFVIIGDAVEGKFSGIHYPRAKAIGDRCSETMEKAGCFDEGADCGI